MKKNLFTVSLRDQGDRLYLLRLFATFLFSIFCNLQANAAVIDSVNYQKNSQDIIYVSGNVEITGASQFSNAQISIISEKISPVSPNAVKNLPAKLKAISPIVLKKKENEEVLKVLQQKINRRVATYFSSTSQHDELISLARRINNYCATGTSLFSFKYALALLSNEETLKFFLRPAEKQKDDTLLSYLQFANYRSSSLRAPPIS